MFLENTLLTLSRTHVRGKPTHCLPFVNLFLTLWLPIVNLFLTLWLPIVNPFLTHLFTHCLPIPLPLGYRKGLGWVRERYRNSLAYLNVVPTWYKEIGKSH